MNATNPYLPWVEGFAEALRGGAAIGAIPAATAQAPSVGARPGARNLLIFSPHPDDEVIVGGLPLRLMRELGYKVVNVAVTLGSRLNRRADRSAELQAACGAIGFGLVIPDPDGLEGINLRSREYDPGRWRSSVAAVSALLAAERPAIVFLPHARDWNVTHIGTHHLVVEAMRALPDLACHVVETEYWGAMDAPNLMIESAPADVADLIAALSLHTGEVARNAYHLRMPAWMIDNVRRGAELVGGQGEPAPRFVFATLYRLRGWADGNWREVLRQGRSVSADETLEPLFSATAKGD